MTLEEAITYLEFTVSFHERHDNDIPRQAEAMKAVLAGLTSADEKIEKIGRLAASLIERAQERPDIKSRVYAEAVALELQDIISGTDPV